jgi:methionyl-tRNA formyltransferase
MTKKSKIVFFGNERLSTGFETYAPTLSGLLHAGYDVVALVVNHTESSSRNARRLEVREIAEKHGIPVFAPARPDELLDELRDMAPEIGVLVAYGKIVSQKVIDVFPKGIVNIHPSLLPNYRGPTPIEQPLLDGATQTGVSLMQLASGMDSGPVYASQKVDILPHETKQNLTNSLLGAGATLLLENLPSILDGSLQPKEQDESKATFCKLISKQDGEIDWTKPAEQLEREIRAYAGWPKSFTTLGDIKVVITQAQVIKEGASSGPGTITIGSENDTLLISTGDGLLGITNLIPEGKKEMPVRAFLQGYKNKLGV